MVGCVYEWMVVGCVDGWMYGWMVVGCVYGWMDGRLCEWIDGWMDGGLAPSRKAAF